MSLSPIPPPTNENDKQTNASFRSLPQNIEAEKSLIGAIFANNRAYEKVSEFLLPEHFIIAQNVKITHLNFIV